jgi:hypothetical protein
MFQSELNIDTWHKACHNLQILQSNLLEIEINTLSDNQGFPSLCENYFFRINLSINLLFLREKYFLKTYLNINTLSTLHLRYRISEYHLKCIYYLYETSCINYITPKIFTEDYKSWRLCNIRSSNVLL